MTGQAQIRHIGHILILPLVAVALVPLMLTELHVFSSHDLVGSVIPDTVFLEHAAQGLMRGHVPYAARFLIAPDSRLTFIYPPLSLLLAVPPLLAGPHYSLGFSIQMVVVIGVALLALDLFCRRCRVSFPVALIAALLMLAVGPVVGARLDGLQGVVLAAAGLALRSRRVTLALVLVTLAALVKETVVVAVIPVVVWGLWPADGQRWTEGLGRRLAAIGWGLVPALLVVVVFGVWSRGRVLGSALAGIHRGVEIESLPATISYLLRPLFRLHSYTGALASVQVSGREVSIVAGAVGVVGVAALLWGAVHFARERRRPATAITFALAVSLATTPVLSPQYVLALLPILVLAAATEFPAFRAYVLLGSGLVTALLTQVEFPYLFGSVAALDPIGMAIVALRNLFLIALAVNLARPAPQASPANGAGAIQSAISGLA